MLKEGLKINWELVPKTRSGFWLLAHLSFCSFQKKLYWKVTWQEKELYILKVLYCHVPLWKWTHLILHLRQFYNSTFYQVLSQTFHAWFMVLGNTRIGHIFVTFRYSKGNLNGQLPQKHKQNKTKIYLH